MLNKKVTIVLTLLLLGTSMYFLARGAQNLFFSDTLNTLSTQKNNLTQSKTTKKPFKHYSAVLNRNLLKAQVRYIPPKKVQPQKQTKIVDLPISQQGWTLLGTIRSDDPQDSFAIILIDRVQQLVKTNRVVKGWKISEIRRRAVVLTKGNKQEILLIDENDKKIAAKSAVKPKFQLTQQSLQAALLDAGNLAKQINIQRSGKGFEIRFLKPDSLFYKLGLRRGDVILKINGKSVKSFKGLSDFTGLMSASSVDFDILRKNKSQKLTNKIL
ncbi:MAG: PDZ domain-containing protein [Desulfovibrio sp.]